MPKSTESHYDTLGVPRDAQQGDIVSAYERLAVELRKATTPPDPRREARIREAFEVLSDKARRAHYDQSVATELPALAPRRAGAVAGVVAALVALFAVAAYLFLSRGATPAQADRVAREILAEVVNSVGRVQSIDLAGKATTTGMAFTVAKGVMATTCEGLEPGAQVVVTLGTRAVPARIAMADEALGLCKLAVDGAGSWPLPLSAAPPRAGDKVFAAGVNAAGDVVLTEGAVKRVAAEARSTIVEASVPAATAIGGRPLLDVQGRVVGAATALQTDGAVRHVRVPPAWATEESTPAPTAPAVPGARPASPASK